MGYAGIEMMDLHSLSLLTDAEILMGKLDSSLFPGLSSSIEVHDGFKGAQSEYAIRKSSLLDT